ncbi:MAG: endonuclease/exonuclease/phosphatase family protein, partial [Acidimicrobiales bacterium]|nr:endonuclease/exonuclease/phosphatase family protein [Acidimicrobiales bacterium]
MPSLRVVQLNVGSLLDPGWKDRRHEVVAWLDRLQPDVVCLEEVWESDSTQNTADWIADQSQGAWHRIFGGHLFGEGLWPDPTVRYGSAILSQWPIDDHHVFRLPVLDDGDARLAAAPFELLHARTADLDVFATHLAPAPTHGLHRRAQVVAIDTHVKEVRGDRDAQPAPGQRRPFMPPILCGDFNAEPNSDEIRFLTSLASIDGRTTFFQDAWLVGGSDNPGYTQDWRTHSLAARLNVHRKRIDYVFVGDPFLRSGNAGRVQSAQVVFHEPITGVVASD